MRITLLTLLLALMSALRPAAAADRPNIIYLMTDDQRMDTLGCYGNPIIHTPNVDRLAAQGVRFTNAFVTTAICMTNRACVFTGQYAARHGVIDFRTEFTQQQLAETYPGVLKAAGYRIGFIGKWGVGKPPDDFFDYDRGFPGQGNYYLKVDGRDRHLTDVMGDQALEFLDGCSNDAPFCLSVSFKAPHVQDQDKVNMFQYDPAHASWYEDVTIPPAPLSTPEFFEALPAFLRESENRVRWEQRFSTPEKYQRNVKAYYRLITEVDLVVGRVVEALRQKGFADNTIIIYTSDHGFYLGERGFAGKWYAHELSIRIPLIVYDPRLPAEQRGTTRDEIALAIDMAPTMLEYAGAKSPRRVQGVSLVPLVNGQTPEKWRTQFFYEHMFEHPKIPRNQGVRTPRWKYARYIDSQPLYEELYDMRNDPDEGRNLAADPKYQKQLETMRGLWEKWAQRAQ